MAVTKNILIERIARHLSNGTPSDDFTVSDNEIWLYCLDAIGKLITAKAKESWQMEQVWELSESFYTRLKFTAFMRDDDLDEYYIVLPNPPIGLPLGVSIMDVYLAGKSGKKRSFYPIKANRQAYFNDTVKGKTDAYYSVIGTKLNLIGVELLGNKDNLYVVMVSPVSDGTLNLGDDAINDVFIAVLNVIRQRYALPQDNNNDGLDKRQ